MKVLRSFAMPLLLSLVSAMGMHSVSAAVVSVAAQASALEAEHSNAERRAFMQKVLFGQIHYMAKQGQYYEALQLVADNDLLSEAQIRDRLKQQKQDKGEGYLSLADIELAYRMNQRAGNAVREVLDADIELKKRNQAAYELAKLYYDKQQYDYARFALQLIRGDLYYPFEHDVAYLIAMLDARTGKVEQAMASLEELKSDDRNIGFAAFNLAHLQLSNGEVAAGIQNLIEIGELESKDPAVSALTDKANIVLGYRYLEDEDLPNAIKYLSKVKLDGVFTNKALLGLAWAHMKAGEYRAAIVPWTHLSQRRPVDTAVLESYIALPYVYGKLAAYNKAAVLYRDAIDIFTDYEKVLAHSLKLLDEGHMPALSPTAGVTLSADTDEARQNELLVDLLASKQYREAYHNYLDLQHMLSVLAARQHSLTITQSMVTERNRHYEADIARLDAQLAGIDSRLKAARQHRDELDMSITEVSDRIDASALTAKDTHANALYASLDDVGIAQVASDTQQQVSVLPAGSAASDHPVFRQQLQAIRVQRDELERIMRLAESRRDLIVSKRDTLTSYEEFLLPVATLVERVLQLRTAMGEALDSQTVVLKSMAGDALQSRMSLIKGYAITAKYELAKSYDVIAEQEKRQ